jgi:hypothetical protein
MLAQTTSMSSRVAARIICVNVGVRSPLMDSTIGRTRTPQPLLVSGYFRLMPAAMALSSSAAAETVTPFISLPVTA